MKLRRSAPGRQAMTKLDRVSKSRDITLLTKLRTIKTMVFPVVMYGCESWTIKKAKHQRIDAFELWCWRKTLESPLHSKEIKPANPKGNQSWIFTGKIDAEAPILWPPDTKSQLIGKDPDEGKRRRRQQRMRWLDSITDSMDKNLNKFQVIVENRGVWCVAVHGVTNSWTWVTEQQC